MTDYVSEWWTEAQHDFAELAPEKKEGMVRESLVEYLSRGGEKLSRVRKRLLESLKHQLIPLGVLNEFQVAGVFVNWWDSVKYDLKTIMSTGWFPGLIPDDYMARIFFASEREEIDDLENRITEYEGRLEEAIEEARNLLEYEADEDEEITVKLMKDLLKSAFNESSIEEETNSYKKVLEAIADFEKKIKETRKEFRSKEEELRLKIWLKKFGVDDEKAKWSQLLHEVKKNSMDSLKMKRKSVKP